MWSRSVQVHLSPLFRHRCSSRLASAAASAAGWSGSCRAHLAASRPVSTRGRVTAPVAGLFSLPFLRGRAMASTISDKWWDDGTVAVVTGANKGIGYAIARELASQGLKTVVTARNEELGQEATKKIAAEAEGTPKVIFHRLDISDRKSVDDFAQWAKAELGRVDLLINNAGIAFKGDAFGPEEAQTTMATNFEGTRAVCEAVAPLIPSGGRIVNVCSLAGKLRILKSDELKQRFTGATSADQVAELAKDFVARVGDGTYEKAGYPGSMYGMSKLCEATYSRVLAQDLKERGISVYACCPGYVATDMSSHKGHKTIEQGAETEVWLALASPAPGTGKFYSDCKEEPF